MKVYVPIYFKDKNNVDNIRTIQYVNPNATESQLADFVEKLNSLTDNQLTKALRVVEDFCKDTDADISRAQIHSVVNHTYVSAPDDDPITQADIDSVIDGSYSPVD